MSARAAYAGGMREALRLRARARIGLTDAVCAVDVALGAGLEVRFADLPSLEGMYADQRPPSIVLSSLRPPGRRSFTCAHELGHHTLGHGTRVDEYVAEELASVRRRATEERQATGFAGFLLMPATAVDNAFHVRGWSPASCTPSQAYAIANWFGVSYAGLLEHLSVALRRMPLSHADELKRVAPRDIRAALLLDVVVCHHIVLVDAHWHNRAVDIEVGDAILLPAECEVSATRCQIIAADAGRTVAVATRPGLGHVTHIPSGWSAFVRVARAGFTGRACYRHLEDDDG